MSNKPVPVRDALAFSDVETSCFRFGNETNIFLKGAK
jgi:hypothetical protein